MSSSRDILTRQNPTITDVWDGKSYGNTGSHAGAYDAVLFNETYNATIQEWTDFTYDAIDLAYGDLLGESPPAFRSVNTPTSTPTTIAEENGIDKLGEAWTCNIIRAPIKAAGTTLRSRPTVATRGSPSDPTLSSHVLKWKNPKFARTEMEPDWALFDKTPAQMKKYQEESSGTAKPLVFSVGDSKMWQKWQSAWIHKSLAKGHIDRNPARPVSGSLRQTHDVTTERLKPLEQLATYCRFAETRYGFTLTQKEAVVFRVRRIDNTLITPGEDRKLHAAFEYKSIPWDASGPGRLTVNLAIWTLGCMGMNDAHRAMEAPGNKPLPNMTRLTKWTHDKAKKVYRNVISGREISEKDWTALKTKTSIANIDDAPAGLSLTKDFTAASGIAGLTQGVQNINLGPGAGNANNGGGRTTQTAKKPTPQPTRPSSSDGPRGSASPPKRYIVEGTNGPAFVLKQSGDKIYFQKDAQAAPITVQLDSKKRYYYTVTDPRTRKPQVFYLKQV